MDQGNTAFLLIAAALVLLMTPGLAFFYGGLVKAKSVISMMMLSFGAMGLIGVLWVLYGYAITFSNAGVGDYFGIDGVIGIDWSQIGLQGAFNEATGGDITTAYPTLAFAAFQATFAIITVALISGAIADRAKFGAWMVFAGIWATVVYFPVASWVFNFTVTDGTITDGGWIAYVVGANDFAGGTAVHINAGAAALALALVLGKRVNFAKGIHKPHNPPFVLLGAGLLWFGWFGFNAGSELAADGIAAVAFLNTIAAPAAAILGWLVVEKIKDGKPTSVGAASGAVAGLVAITPACNILTPFWSIVLGILVGALVVGEHDEDERVLVLRERALIGGRGLGARRGRTRGEPGEQRDGDAHAREAGGELHGGTFRWPGGNPGGSEADGPETKFAG
jgi:Amt family ammonium transporter